MAVSALVCVSIGPNTKGQSKDECLANAFLRERQKGEEIIVVQDTGLQTSSVEVRSKSIRSKKPATKKDEEKNAPTTRRTLDSRLVVPSLPWRLPWRRQRPSVEFRCIVTAINDVMYVTIRATALRTYDRRENPPGTIQPLERSMKMSGSLTILWLCTQPATSLLHNIATPWNIRIYDTNAPTALA